MENDNTQAVNEAARPVGRFTNDMLRGDILVCKRVYEANQSRVSGLRQQHQAYLDSLPKESTEAMCAIVSALQRGTDIGEDGHAARSALVMVQEMAMGPTFNDMPEIKEALHWLTTTGLRGLTGMERNAQEALEIARQFHPRAAPYQA